MQLGVRALAAWQAGAGAQQEKRLKQRRRVSEVQVRPIKPSIVQESPCSFSHCCIHLQCVIHPATRQKFKVADIRLHVSGCGHMCMAAVVEDLSNGCVLAILTCLQQKASRCHMKGSQLALELAGLPASQGSASPISGLVGAPQCLHCEETKGCPGKGPAL